MYATRVQSHRDLILARLNPRSGQSRDTVREGEGVCHRFPGWRAPANHQLISASSIKIFTVAAPTTGPNYSLVGRSLLVGKSDPCDGELVLVVEVQGMEGPGPVSGHGQKKVGGRAERELRHG